MQVSEKEIQRDAWAAKQAMEKIGLEEENADGSLGCGRSSLRESSGVRRLSTSM